VFADKVSFPINKPKPVWSPSLESVVNEPVFLDVKTATGLVVPIPTLPPD
jgi:hypothetical protein